MQLKKLEKTKDLLKIYDLVNALDKIMVEHFKLVRYGIPVHNIGMNLMLQYLLKRFLGKDDAMKYYPVLISGLNHKLTQTNENIHELAHHIQKHEELTSLVLNIDSKNIYAKLKILDTAHVKEFLKSFHLFLEKEGDRGFTREPYYPSCSDAPEYVFDILKSLLMERPNGVESLKGRQKKFNQLIKREAEQKVRSQFLGYIKWKIVLIILNLSRRYIKFREEQRFNLDRWISRNRKVFIIIGEIFREKGILERPVDVFFLYKREIEKLIFKKVSSSQMNELKPLLIKRKQEFHEFKDKIPPKFIIGKKEYDDTIQFNEGSSVYEGIAASQGITKGPIKVLNHIEDIPHVKKGDILVVPRADPGWTPVFSKIGGFVTETGGILSHGAVVSREYGIPAVTNITSACKLFKTGQYVMINGFNGQVVLLKKQ